MKFQPFNKIPRLSRGCIITEKIDGTNASVIIIPPMGEDELRGNGNYWERLYGDDWSEFDLTSQERSMIIHYLLGKEFGLLRSTQRSIGDKQ